MVTMLHRTSPLAARVGLRVQLLRKRQGLSQDQLAQKTGYRRAAIASIETGRILPSLEKMLDLAAALRVRPSALLDEELAPLTTPLPAWNLADRRAFLCSLRRLVAELEEVAPPA